MQLYRKASKQNDEKGPVTPTTRHLQNNKQGASTTTGTSARARRILAEALHSRGRKSGIPHSLDHCLHVKSLPIFTPLWKFPMLENVPFFLFCIPFF
ncbi:hypothetical protein CDAR_590531 [Caerostris darwini]|uniref:Uncharacterized protein n=1 Tax=Caerostris darwini TaxID=1538125 RepID=A0AAV4TNY3_9ARAC|nr:hypothetical protein CDAR_590531 [Caerostris darwini]